MLSIDVIHNILSYADELRVLKIQMDRKNMKYIFENDSAVYDYLVDKTSSTTPCLGEGVYLTTLKVLNCSEVHMDNVFTEVEQYFKRWNIIISYELFYSILGAIINDYNNYYLNDEYYYGGYWYDEEWHKYEEQENEEVK